MTKLQKLASTPSIAARLGDGADAPAGRCLGDGRIPKKLIEAAKKL